MIIRPEGYQDSDAFLEIAQSLKFALLRLGYFVEVRYHTMIHGIPNIIFGAHLLSAEEMQALPVQCIVYNLEQRGAHHFTPDYLGLAQRFWIWDYSPENLALWQSVPGLRYEPLLVKVGYMPEMTCIQKAVEDVDVLLYGSLIERRLNVIQALQARGVQAFAVRGVYGAERDVLIARSKIILNIHFYEASLFEVVRVSYLLANHKLVVSEPSPDIGELTGAVVVAPYESLADECVSLLQDEEKRRSIERRGFEVFSKCSEVEIMRHALRQSPFLFPPLMP